MKKLKIALLIFLLVDAAVATYLYLRRTDIAVLSPKGLIAIKERELFITAIALMLIVVIPVVILTFVFAWRYRADHPKEKYSPEMDQNLLAEVIWWGFPLAIVIGLSILTWRTTHELDPFKPLAHEKPPLKIQVVALQWKWLFIYPEQKIATVNYLRFPKETPLSFELTADAPMNSFWIPELGGQIYAMPGMRSKLHLIAHEVGDFRGVSAHLSGKGFAGMEFMAEARSEDEFAAWVEEARSSAKSLSSAVYEQLVKPSSYVKPATYTLQDDDLFETIAMKYMAP